MSVRQSELLAAVSAPLLKYLASHAKELVMNNAALLLIMAIITKAQGMFIPSSWNILLILSLTVCL